jgi:hypothetical protein
VITIPDSAITISGLRSKLRLHGGLIVAFTRALRVSSDEILGIKELNPYGPFKDRRFLKRLEMIDKLPRRDRQVLLATIDRFLAGLSDRA